MKNFVKNLKVAKGYNVWALIGISVAFVCVTIVISFGGQILGKIKTGQTASSAEANITQKGIDSLTTFGDWLPTLALVVIAAIIIGIIVTYLVVRLFGNQGGAGGM